MGSLASLEEGPVASLEDPVACPEDLVACLEDLVACPEDLVACLEEAFPSSGNGKKMFAKSKSISTDSNHILAILFRELKYSFSHLTCCIPCCPGN